MRPLLAIAAIAATLATFPGQARPIEAIEYFHAGFDHYFVTTSPEEAATLDAGVAIRGWTRTGSTFYVDDSAGPGLSPVCRFFSTAFGPKSSHFYTPDVSECMIVSANPSWQLESTGVFAVAQPSAAGTCSVDRQRLYRLYNNGQGGAPNHRYTTDPAVRYAMIAKGWIPEGAGAAGVIACVPVFLPTAPTAEGLWSGFSDSGSGVVGFVLDTGAYYFLYMQPGTPYVAGVVLGNLSVSGSSFTSSDARDFNLAQGIFSGTITGSFVPRSSLSGTAMSALGSSTFSLTYQAAYEQPASLTDAAGTYFGDSVGDTGSQSVALSLSAGGAISGSAAGGCSFTGTAKRHGNVGVFDLSVKFGGGTCAFGTATLSGIAYYDAASRRLYALAPNASRTNGFLFIGAK